MASVADVQRYLERLLRYSYVYVHLEPTNACNADCAICPRSAMSRRLEMMPWAVFEEIMNLALPSPTPMLAFVGFGEPTLHRRLADMIDYARQRRPDIAIKLTTNGSRLGPSEIERLIHAGLDLLEISVFGHSPDTYESEMPPLKFNDISTLVSYLNKKGLPYSLTTVASTADADTTRAFWRSVGATSLSIKGLHRRGGYLPLADKISRPSALGEYDQRVRVDSSELLEDSCHKLYMFLHVNASGKILPCVQEINESNAIGHVSNHRTMRQVLSHTRRHRPTFDICVGCELYEQDLLRSYAGFFSKHFPDRLPIWETRLSEAVGSLEIT